MYSISRQHSKAKIPLPLLYVKLYLYQLSRALAHIHSLGICHRDIKPQNLLVNPETQQLKLCDFGSAKALVKGEPNVAYICSRYYRAPELIFGSTDYTTAIDVWSQGKCNIDNAILALHNLMNKKVLTSNDPQAVLVQNYSSVNPSSLETRVSTNWSKSSKYSEHQPVKKSRP